MLLPSDEVNVCPCVSFLFFPLLFLTVTLEARQHSSCSPLQNLCSLSIYQKASKRVRPQKANVNQITSCSLNVSLCKMKHVRKPHTLDYFGVRHLHGRGYNICLQAHMTDVEKSSYRCFILALFCQWVSSFDEELNIFQMCRQFQAVIILHFSSTNRRAVDQVREKDLTIEIFSIEVISPLKKIIKKAFMYGRGNLGQG